MAAHGLAPIRSILLMNINLGTLYLFIYLSTVNVYGYIPDAAHIINIAPSNTLNALSTSIVKSTCPGVSITFI